MLNLVVYSYVALAGVAHAEAKVRSWLNLFCHTRLVQTGGFEEYLGAPEARMLRDYLRSGAHAKHLAWANMFDPVETARLRYLHQALADSRNPVVKRARAEYAPYTTLELPPLKVLGVRILGGSATVSPSL